MTEQNYIEPKIKLNIKGVNVTVSFAKENNVDIKSTLFSMQVFCMYISSSVVQFLISFSYKIRTIIFEPENWNNYNTIQNTILRFFNVSRETFYCEMYFPIFFILCFLNWFYMLHMLLYTQKRNCYIFITYLILFLF